MATTTRLFFPGHTINYPPTLVEAPIGQQYLWQKSEERKRKALHIQGLSKDAMQTDLLEYYDERSDLLSSR